MTQLTLSDAADGSMMKGQGQEQSEEHGSAFIAYMRQQAIAISDQAGFVSSDNLRVIAAGLGLVPHSANVWGSIFRGPHWKIVGRQKSQLPGNHAREIRIWKYER